MGTYILWDVDGTLLRNGKDARNLYHEAIELAAGRAIANQLPHMHGKTDGQILTEALAIYGLEPSLHPVASAHLDDLSRLRHEAGMRREICPGVPDAMEAFAARGWTNALLTGNSAMRARFKLAGAGLDVDAFDWKHSYFGDVSPMRSELTIRAQEELLRHAIVIIGDTPGDDIAAQAAGIPFIAVATGVYSVEDLAETDAALVVDDLDEGLPAVLALIDGFAR
ncbi:MAG: hydrolase [Glaciihabitans sp.]|nr:hydrolase [Glaciihabitans sp.]